MTTSTDEENGARLLREAVAMLEPPPLAPDTFARIAERRESGERISLLTADVHTRIARRTGFIAASLGAAAALVITSLALNLHRDSATSGVAAPDRFSLAPVDSACANLSPMADASVLRHLMISAFGVSAACGAEPVPDAPIAVDPSQVVLGTFTYRSLSITDGVFTSVHEPSTITIARTRWRDAPALLAVRDGPLITRVSLDSLTVSLTDLAPLHWASWYGTQHSAGVLHADFDSSSVTMVMTGRFDTTGTFPYARIGAQLPFEWVSYLVVPAIPLTKNWHGTIRILAPIHPRASKLFVRTWETMSLRVIGRERLRVAAGDFDCWKLQVGEPDDRSFMWVGASNHLVIRSQTIHRFGDTEFEDRIDLQRATYPSH
jgi:hypothetical protein